MITDAESPKTSSPASTDKGKILSVAGFPVVPSDVQAVPGTVGIADNQIDVLPPRQPDIIPYVSRAQNSMKDFCAWSWHAVLNNLAGDPGRTGSPQDPRHG
jgi:hypothetical protein